MAQQKAPHPRFIYVIVEFLLRIYHKLVQPFLLLFGKPKSEKLSRHGSTKKVDMSSKEAKYIKENIDRNTVMMFSKSYCPYCNRAKQLLEQELGVAYGLEELDLREDCQAVQDVLRDWTGGRSVPRIFIGGNSIGGNNEVWLLYNEGKLLPMLKEAGASFVKTK